MGVGFYPNFLGFLGKGFRFMPKPTHIFGCECMSRTREINRLRKYVAYFCGNLDFTNHYKQRRSNAKTLNTFKPLIYYNAYLKLSKYIIFELNRSF